jgi:hypothetical protein
LDGKFVPHGTYGINHTKHDLEYGYLIVGLVRQVEEEQLPKEEGHEENHNKTNKQ